MRREGYQVVSTNNVSMLGAVKNLWCCYRLINHEAVAKKFTFGTCINRATYQPQYIEPSSPCGGKAYRLQTYIYGLAAYYTFVQNYMYW